MTNTTYQLRFLIGLAIALAYSYAAFEYKWEEEEKAICCIASYVEEEFVLDEIFPFEEEHIPITYQNNNYVPEFKQLDDGELQEALKEVLEEEMANPDETEEEPQDECKPCSSPLDAGEVFYTFEQNARPKNGMKAFYAFLKKEFHYPKELKQAHIEGKVFVQFTVEKSGKLANIKIIRGLHPLFDQEVLRVMNLAPDWISGKQRCCPIRQKMTFPISFRATH